MARTAKLAVGVGLCLLVVGLGLVYVGSPTYRTQVGDSAPNESAMAAATAYETGELDSIPFERLSAAEQRAFTQARTAPDGVYTDRGVSDDGPNFEYRNDIVTEYFVTYRDAVYTVRVVIAIGPVRLVAGVLSAATGLVVSGVGGQRLVAKS